MYFIFPRFNLYGATNKKNKGANEEASKNKTFEERWEEYRSRGR